MNKPKLNVTETIHALTQEYAEHLNAAVDKVNAIAAVLSDASLGELAEAFGDAPTSRPATRTTRTSKPAARKAGKSVKSGRLARRSPEQIATAIEAVARLLSKHPEGLRSEQIREELNLDKREVPRLLQQGVADRAFKILHGEKRATTYGAGKGGRKAPKLTVMAGGKKTAKKPAKKVAKKTAKKARKQKKPVKRMAPKKKAAAAKKPAKKASAKAKATNHMAAAATPA